ncbi:hypothetical protein BO70DRAFT_385904 [Aspergillus heteromorphus CBS 117.55]|uniref:Protein kinase domain-containing protein n=1 Tax=Aspergillus heteromorphus CBS 117.55 TaxID=1448321 RepID=A0A317WTT8_9EURO|nr:uncharacterized protein BO70DRAFT_385904 [Aspergillus heteromorphus CBS 117.55]PWY87650.1 hypothetical protein BO70DRAFT_385904 [Aspergillus heteromorphus CBS 117.55]
MLHPVTPDPPPLTASRLWRCRSLRCQGITNEDIVISHCLWWTNGRPRVQNDQPPSIYKDYLAQETTEPSSRSQTLIYHAEDNNRWWIKASKHQRRVLYQDFVTRINYDSILLLADTVTEITLGDTATTGHQEGKFAVDDATGTTESLNVSLRCRIREDPLRVVYPLCDEFPYFRKFTTDQLIRDAEITEGVFWVYNNGIRYVLKIVNRSIYEPRDTDVFRKELQNLEYFAGVPNIVQSAGVAGSTNPYRTSNGSGGQLVLTGILLEAYSGGSLQQAAKTHMDIKPSNVVLDSEGNAVVIDISGIGGISRQWCSPEIQDELSPFDLPFSQRRLNDVWAYGKLLSKIGAHAKDDPFAKTLKQVADCLMKEGCQTRMSLSKALSQLKGTDNQTRYTMM